MKGFAQTSGARPPIRFTFGNSRRWRQWTALLREPGATIGLFLVVTVLLAGLLAPWLPLDDPTKINLPDRMLSPSTEQLLGTDHLGRDTFSRIIHGARITLLAAAATLTLSMTIALTVGILSGYRGGWLDTALMGVVDLLLAFPSLILALAVAGALGPRSIQRAAGSRRSVVGGTRPHHSRHHARRASSGLCNRSLCSRRKRPAHRPATHRAQHHGSHHRTRILGHRLDYPRHRRAELLGTGSAAAHAGVGRNAK